MDESGCLPKVLNLIHKVHTNLSCRQAANLLYDFGISVSKSQVHRLNVRLNIENNHRKAEKLTAQSSKPLTHGDNQKRHWIAEIDGVIVPTINPDKPKEVWWRENKVCVLYKMSCPGVRYVVTHIGPVEEFAPLVHGLLRQAGVSQKDILIGVSDGAPWISGLFGDIGVKHHILDVFHAEMRINDVMIGLGWSEERRQAERRLLMKGEIDIQHWLNINVRVKWENSKTEVGKKAQIGLKYLEKQAVLNHTCYPKFKAEGIEVIGSGQVEGANKSMIGARLKLSGAKWNLSGANGMSCARAEQYSGERIIPFDFLRLVTFPQAA
jgi:hypothetical protein